MYLNKLWYFIIGSSYGFSQWNSVIYVMTDGIIRIRWKNSLKISFLNLLY